MIGGAVSPAGNSQTTLTPDGAVCGCGGGPLAVRMTLPPAGFAVYQAAPGLHRLGPNPPPDLKPWQPRRGPAGVLEGGLLLTAGIHFRTGRFRAG